MSDLEGQQEGWQWKVGLMIVAAAVAGGGLEASGWQFPILQSWPRQLALGSLGIGMCCWWFFISQRPRCFVVTTPRSSISVPKGTLENPRYETTHFGGHRIEVKASRFFSTSDGQQVVFLDRWGSPVKMLPRSSIHQIDVVC